MSSSYEKFIEQVDKLAAKLQARYSKHLVCREGCSGCCHHHLSVFAVEAEEARAAVEALPAQVRARVEEQAREVIEREAQGRPVVCSLLVDGRCSIYQSRPLICRTQGLPLLMEAEDGEQEVDFCPLNFTEAGAVDELDPDHLVPLDALNLRLAVVNLQHCRETGRGDEASGERIKMADIVLKSRVVRKSGEMTENKEITEITEQTERL